MSPHDHTGEKLPDEKICELVFEAGYNGMAIDLGASDVKKAFELQPLMEKIGLTPLIVAFPKTINSLSDTMKMAKDFGSPFINVIGQVMPISVDGMIPVIRKWIDMADKIGIPIQFETHRNCITNDLYSTLQLLDAIPEMRMCSDLSHYVVDREFWYPLSERDLGMISRILDRSDSFQGRVASRQQIQLQMQAMVQQMGPQAQQNPQFVQFQRQLESIQVAIEARKSNLIAEFTEDYAQAEKQVLNQIENDPVLKLKDRDLDLKAREEQRKEEEGQQKANMDMMKLMQNRDIADEKLEQDDNHAKLRASVSLAKQGINQMKAVVKETS